MPEEPPHSLFTPPPSDPPGPPGPPSADGPPARQPGQRLLALLAPGLSTLLVLGLPAVILWSPAAAGVAVVLLAVLVTALGACAHLAARRGVVAPYVVVAIVLPYLLLGGVLVAGQARYEADQAASRAASEAAREDLGGASDFVPPVVGGAGSSPQGGRLDWATDRVVGLGDTGRVDEFEVVVTSSTCDPARVQAALAGDATPTPGESFCVVGTSWTNRSEAPAAVSAYRAFVRVGLAGRVAVDLTETTRGESALATRKAGYDGSPLAPGQSADLRTVVSVPDSWPPQRLVAHTATASTGGSGTEEIAFDLDVSPEG